MPVGEDQLEQGAVGQGGRSVRAVDRPARRGEVSAGISSKASAAIVNPAAAKPQRSISSGVTAKAITVASNVPTPSRVDNLPRSSWLCSA
jgi:hypothetical protein